MRPVLVLALAAVLAGGAMPLASPGTALAGLLLADPPAVAALPCEDDPPALSVMTPIGSPRRSVAGVPEAGVVEVHRAGSALTITSAMVGVAPQARGWFGAAVDVNDLTSGDRCADLVIGMPGANGARGGVVIVPDFGRGFEPAAARWLPTDAPALKPGDQLGGAVASAGALLVAGAPGRDAPKAPNAGALVSWVIATDNAQPSRVIRAAPPVTYVQGTRGIRGHAETNDRFGSVLYLSGLEEELTLAVGIPDEDIGRARDAGAVALLTWGQDGRWWGDNQLLWQGHGGAGWYGLPGRSRAGDRLGAAVSYHDKKGAFGVPGKDVNGRRNSGAVLVWRGNLSTGRYHLVTQGTRGVPGGSERGDAFGSAVVMRQDCWPCQVLAVGVPGEDLGRRRNVGAVVHIWVQDAAGEPTFASWRQPTSGLAAGDRFGSRLLGDWWKSARALLVGAPGEDRPGARDAGRYHQAQPTGIGVVATGATPNERLGG